MKKIKKITLVIVSLLVATFFTYYFVFSFGVASLFDFGDFIKEENTNTKTFLKEAFDPSGNYAFSYPGEVSTQYIQTYQWPPKLVVIGQNSFCSDVQNVSEKMKTESRNIAGHDFCVTTVSKVKDGNLVDLYAYSLNLKNKTYVIYFGTKHENCAEMKTDEKFFCESEVISFHPDLLAVSILQTVRLVNSGIIGR